MSPQSAGTTACRALEAVQDACGDSGNICGGLLAPRHVERWKQYKMIVAILGTFVEGLTRIECDLGKHYERMHFRRKRECTLYGDPYGTRITRTKIYINVSKFRFVGSPCLVSGVDDVLSMLGQQTLIWLGSRELIKGWGPHLTIKGF
ncbi:hypothetical protein BC829DRAFT_424164 [Chytridium lagenaria]|nr:hypothetical protein BC829DRAFT_424164 [Chytridium lagenaria]